MPVSPSPSISRWRVTCDVPLQKGRQSRGSGFPPPATWRRSRASTRTRCSERSDTYREEGLLEFRRGRGIIVSGTPERGALILRARELLDFARRQGFESDEVVRVIETLGMSTDEHTDDTEASTGRGLLERALPVLGPRLERQPQPAARRRSGRPRARPGPRRRVRRGRRRHLAGPARLGCGGDRHLERRPRAWGAARAGGRSRGRRPHRVAPSRSPRQPTRAGFLRPRLRAVHAAAARATHPTVQRRSRHRCARGERCWWSATTRRT